MKHNFKLKERLGALLLAMLFILQAILGLVPVCVTQAAPLTVETWDSDKVVEYGYRPRSSALLFPSTRTRSRLSGSFTTCLIYAIVPT